MQFGREWVGGCAIVHARVRTVMLLYTVCSVLVVYVLYAALYSLCSMYIHAGELHSHEN